ncbi:aspartate aminotransferase [Clostridiaceae bacterium 14S0207]|nr:aspartate aminotransferase [Clostridiaceae bacterium 14S0207]
MENLISKQVRKIEISGIRKFYNEVVKVPGAISLTLGEPDFQVPKIVKEYMIKAMEDDKTRYTANAGIFELREQISLYLRSLGIKYSEDEICVTVGGSEGLNSVFLSLIDKGDKILIPNPAYPAYESCVKIAGGEVVNYSLKNDFTIDIKSLEKEIKLHDPKVLVLSFPTNPTGSVLTKEDLQELHKIIKEHNIIVVSDEIYASLIYEEEYYSVAQLEDIKEKIILIGGFSKMFSMTGLRVGYVCACPQLMKHIMKVHQYSVSCATSISQWGAYAGLKYCMNEVYAMRDEFKKRRDYVYERLLNMGLELVKPKGAFYAFPSIKKFSNDSFKFCTELLQKEKVAIIPGTAFGSLGEGFVRISYSYSMEELRLALDKMEKYLQTLNK